MPFYRPDPYQHPIAMDVFEDDPPSPSNDEDEDFEPIKHHAQHRQRKRKPRLSSESSESGEADSVFITNPIRNSASPYLTDATDLLSSSKHGLSILEKAFNFSEHLCIAKSDAAKSAGNGLYIVASDTVLRLKRGLVLTWFSGKVVFADKDDPEQIQLKTYSIGLGYSIKNTASIILSDPMNFSLLGCAHRVNHSRHPNCHLEFIEGPEGIIGSILVLNKDIILHQGEALELVFNYGNSATTIHGLSVDCAYNPSPKPIAELELVTATEMMPHDLSDAYSNSSRSESDMLRKKTKMARVEYTPTQMRTLLQQYLPEGSFKILANSDNSIPTFLADDPAQYYFMEIIPELDEFSWILMFFNKQTNTLYFFDPEGLLLDKINHHKFNFSGLKDPCIQLCHSWFVFSRHREDIQYQKTGAICVELAKSINEGLVINSQFIPALSDRSIPWLRSKSIVHMNLQLPFPSSSLSTLLVHYPEKHPTCPAALREQALSSILFPQQDRLLPPPEVPDPLYELPAIEATDVVKKRPSPQFFAEEPFMSLHPALLHYQADLKLSKDDILKLTQQTTTPEKEQLLTLCLKILWNERPGDRENLNRTANQILAQLKDTAQMSTTFSP